MGLFDKKGLDIQSAIDKIQNKVTDVAQQVTEKLENNQTSVQEEYINDFVFCTNCGTKLNKEAKFCHKCGTPVGNVLKTNAYQASQVSYPQRTQEYGGRIIKCPNCGANITETTAICPECGIHITGKSAVSSVQIFKDQLMEIENRRKRRSGGFLSELAPVSKIDLQKLSLIKNFPIPNSVDDCLEFMLLAIANIDVKLSKRTLTNKINAINRVESSATIAQTISDAWVSKMEQIYKKAKVLFPNDPAFDSIQKIYFDKMKELKIKIK